MNRRIGLIALAVVLALVGTIAVYSYAHNADKRAIDKTKSATVLIVQKQVPVATKWADAKTGGYFKVEREPVEAIPSNAIADLNAVIPDDQVTNATIAAGQIALRSMFGDQTAVTGALSIPKGDLAVTVRVTQDNAVAGFVQPESQVSVFVTSKIKNFNAPAGSVTASDQDLMMTKLLLSRVTVIAVSQQPTTALAGKASSNNNNTSSNQDVMITLALTQVQAERLVLAEHTGELTLALLTKDSTVGDDDGQTTGDIKGQISICVCTPAPIFVK